MKKGLSMEQSEQHGTRRISAEAASRLAKQQETPPPLPTRPGRAQRTSPVCGRNVVSIDRIQPSRAMNNYVGLPPPPRPPPPKKKESDVQNLDKTTGAPTTSLSTVEQNRLNRTKEVELKRQQQQFQPDDHPVIVTQPQTAKEGLQITIDPELTENHNSSIICPRCQKCRCRRCVEGPSELPSRWICNGKQECSANCIVDRVSCLCCIQGLFYHCYKDREQDLEVSASDDPCACCERPHCFKRWSTMAALSVCLPCLCLYFPLKGCVALCTCCYNRSKRTGCTCKAEERPTDSALKGLLIESESSSA
ncbi:protein sprouty homolog 2 isoform X2 [Lingula anatina]|uniref:Protein sprouty homolog 2 isoform X2 n=1 Tax=Lingula anatina TaxID=7574 RepID=A0A1S3JRZ9_LINAN|nr:protein sprouty homolog 2 isoform X2 [Lingula anatina]|eukprot:XP_013412779.1 protein sprouty homolog 2 isoform X2 [Lingula anatina]